MRSSLYYQRGMGFYALCMMFVLLAFLALVIIRLFPMYLNQIKIETHINEIAKDPETNQLSKKDLRDTIGKRFMVDGVEHVDLQNNIEITTDPKTKETVIRVKYEARVKLFYNISIVGEFNDYEARVVKN